MECKWFAEDALGLAVPFCWSPVSLDSVNLGQTQSRRLKNSRELGDAVLQSSERLLLGNSQNLENPANHLSQGAVEEQQFYHQLTMKGCVSVADACPRHTSGGPPGPSLLLRAW